MGLKLADTAVPMGNFPVATAANIEVTTEVGKESLQSLYDNGDLGGKSVMRVDEVPETFEDKVYIVGDDIYISDVKLTIAELPLDLILTAEYEDGTTKQYKINGEGM